MHTNRKLSLLLLAVAVCVLSLPSLGQQSAKGKAAEIATTALIKMHSAYQQAGSAQKTQLLTQFQTLATQRQQLLSSLIQTNPGDVLRVAIPGSISHDMPPTVWSEWRPTNACRFVFVDGWSCEPNTRIWNLRCPAGAVNSRKVAI